jgi:hypothetical protein
MNQCHYDIVCLTFYDAAWGMNFKAVAYIHLFYLSTRLMIFFPLGKKMAFLSSYYGDYYLLGYDAVHSGRCSLTFRKTVPLPSSALNSKHPAGFLLAACLVFFSTLKIEVERSPYQL